MGSHMLAQKDTALKRSYSDSSIVPDSEPEPELLGTGSGSSAVSSRHSTKTATKANLEIIELSDSDDSLEFDKGPGLIVLSGKNFLLTTSAFLTCYRHGEAYRVRCISL